MPERQPSPEPGPRASGIDPRYLLLGLAGLFALQLLWAASTGGTRLPYSEFQQALRDGRVSELVVAENEIRGVLQQADGTTAPFATTRVDPKLADELAEYGVGYAGSTPSPLLRLLSWVAPLALFIGVWWFLMRRMMGGRSSAGFMSVGKSRAKVYVEDETRVAFADVAGVDEAKDELAEVVAFLRDPAAYGRLGARMPKGILLVGPPGTGKTLLARAVAGEAGVPFFSISGSEFVEMFVGVGAARVRDLFEQARQKAPCIVFIDELDALGRARGAQVGGAGGHDEKEQTLNQLLVELDGFDTSSGVVLLASTNRPEILDPALLRSGRFDRQVAVDRPDRAGREAILRVHVRSVSLGKSVALDRVAALTPGFTGADLANLVNEAALVATRQDAQRVELDHFTAAIERLVAGVEKRNRLINPREREIVAHHEMGHALVAASLPSADPVHKVSIIPRGLGALGYTLQRPLDDRFLMTREELEDKLAVLLGGRAAEHVVFGHLSTGASDDLARASELARNMVTQYALVPELGNVAHERPRSPFLGATMGPPAYSERTAQQIDQAVRKLVDGAYERARAILERNSGLLFAGAKDLLERETLSDGELAPLFAQLA